MCAVQRRCSSAGLFERSSRPLSRPSAYEDWSSRTPRRSPESSQPPQFLSRSSLRSPSSSCRRFLLGPASGDRFLPTELSLSVRCAFKNSAPGSSRNERTLRRGAPSQVSYEGVEGPLEGESPHATSSILSFILYFMGKFSFLRFSNRARRSSLGGVAGGAGGERQIPRSRPAVCLGGLRGAPFVSSDLL